MLLTRFLRAKSAGARYVMVQLESCITNHKLVKIKPKGDDKMEIIHWDPYLRQNVLYREIKKLRTLKQK